MHERTIEIYFEGPPRKTESIAIVDAFSYVASLDRHVETHTLVARSKIRSFSQTVNTAVHRFEEFIGGRSYIIEAAAVAQDRWRAYIVRLPGVPTALMPFYGATPADAAHQLSNWLTKAHERVSKPGGSV